MAGLRTDKLELWSKNFLSTPCFLSPATINHKNKTLHSQRVRSEGNSNLVCNGTYITRWVTSRTFITYLVNFAEVLVLSRPVFRAMVTKLSR